MVTQFIGNIPLSKAEPHRHLYEEALIFLDGTGVVWTGENEDHRRRRRRSVFTPEAIAFRAMHDAGRI